MIYDDSRILSRAGKFSMNFYFHAYAKSYSPRNTNISKTNSTVIVYHSTGYFLLTPNFLSKFKFRPRILRYQQF